VIRILIADDHCLLRQVVRDIIEREQDLEVVAEAANGQEAALLAAEVQPDVVLMDLAMPVCDGFEATQRILASVPHTRVVIFTASSQEEHLLRALQSGAIGYITKDVGPANLIAAIRRATQNELYLIPPVAARLLALLRTLTPAPSRPIRVLDHSQPPVHAKKKKSKRHLPLSRREQEVLALIRQGQRNREIAHALRISEATVHKHVQNIFEKLNARNRTEALFLAQA
jgi:DNA-binding NarL/FixJ family response regulator